MTRPKLGREPKIATDATPGKAWIGIPQRQTSFDSVVIPQVGGKLGPVRLVGQSCRTGLGGRFRNLGEWLDDIVDGPIAALESLMSPHRL